MEIRDIIIWLFLVLLIIFMVCIDYKMRDKRCQEYLQNPTWFNWNLTREWKQECFRQFMIKKMKTE